MYVLPVVGPWSESLRGFVEILPLTVEKYKKHRLLAAKYILTHDHKEELLDDLYSIRNRVKDRYDEIVKETVRHAAEDEIALVNTLGELLRLRVKVHAYKVSPNFYKVISIDVIQIEPLEEPRFEALLIRGSEEMSFRGTFVELIDLLSGYADEPCVSHIRAHALALPTVYVAPGGYGKTQFFFRLSSYTGLLSAENAVGITMASFLGSFAQGVRSKGLAEDALIIDEAGRRLEGIFMDLQSEWVSVLLDRTDPSSYILRRATGYGKISIPVGLPVSFLVGGTLDSISGFYDQWLHDSQLHTRFTIFEQSVKPSFRQGITMADISSILEALRQAWFRKVFLASLDRRKAIDFIRRLIGFDPEVFEEVDDIEGMHFRCVV